MSETKTASSPIKSLAMSFVVATLAIALISCHGFFTDPVLSSITVSPSTPSIAVGATQQFTARGVNDDGSTATVSSPSWTSSTPATATIDANGLARAVAAGTTTITATSGSITGSTTMTVTTSALQSITVTAANGVTTITRGSNLQLTATARFADGSTKDISSTATWTSSDNSSASVSSTGLVTASATATSSTVTITATSGSIAGAITLTLQ